MDKKEQDFIEEPVVPEPEVTVSPKMKNRVWHFGKKPLLYGILIFIGILIFTPLLTYLYFVRDLSSKETIMNRKSAGIILQDRTGKTFFSFYEARTKKIIPLKDVPLDAQEAVIAIEDKDFYTHHGFSISGFGRAVLENVKDEAFSVGGSTLTQQLVKNTLLSQSKNFLRKYQELFLAIEVERRFEKKDILEMYLNTAYFGEGAFGIEAASETYFGKKASQLTLAESSILAGILPAPSYYSPISGDIDAAKRRQEIVLTVMVKQGYITEEEKSLAEGSRLVFNPQIEEINNTAPHFALMVKDELIKKYGEQAVAQSGYIVKTTLNLAWQEYTAQTVKNQVGFLARNKATNGAAVAIDPKTGEILILVGSHNWNDEENGKINMALAPRQPGSSFKPIVYAKAFSERVMTPATIIDDKQITFPGGYKPRNYDGKFHGKVTARYALANSLNIPAVLTLQKIGVTSGIDMGEQLGITTLDNAKDYGLPLVLGSAEVPLTEMTGAYGVFANQGKKAQLTTILEIHDKNNNLVYEHETSIKNVISAAVAFQIASILSDSAIRADTFGSALNLSRTAAVKTGTTENYRDALTIGFTPSIVVGVWVGNNDNTPMDNIAGSLGAAPIWRSLMEFFLRGTPVETFRQPIGIDDVKVCKEKGLKTDIATSSAYIEYFLSGTVPGGDCNLPTLIPTSTITPTPQPSNTPTATPQATNTPQPTPTPTLFIDTPTPTTDIPLPTVIPTL